MEAEDAPRAVAALGDERLLDLRAGLERLRVGRRLRRSRAG
jgi:hypothetical protein